MAEAEEVEKKEALDWIGLFKEIEELRRGEK